MPVYLRFVRGVIDSEDLPLNVSREILQQNKVMAKIKSNSVKKVLSELETLAKDKEKYDVFWAEYGRPLKEGLYQDFENRETLLELMRFKSLLKDGLISFKEYAEAMKPDQKAIYFITGTEEAVLRNSPLLELYRRKEIDVLIMDDEIDEIVIPSVQKYKDWDLKAVNRTDAADDLKSDADKANEERVKPLAERIKKVLGERVKDVRASSRLSDSPSCIVADANDPTFQMQAMLRAMGQNAMEAKPVLEINPDHPIVQKLELLSDDAAFADAATVLFGQAMLLGGGKVDDMPGFVKKLNAIMERGL